GGYRKRVGNPDQRADQSGQRDELKQLVRRVGKAGLRQFGCDDAPQQPDRKSEMLGKNRPDEITSGNEFTLRFPERLLLGIPVRNPAPTPLAHQCVPFRLGWSPGESRGWDGDKKRRPRRSKAPLSRAAALPVVSTMK